MTLRIQDLSAWMGATAVGLSALGLVVHTVREFGYARLGGAILSILPLPFLPFVPEQTVSHYVSHVIFGITQIPLILVMLKARMGGEAFPGVRL
jgi:hypothetical protein